MVNYILNVCGFHTIGWITHNHVYILHFLDKW